VTPGSLDQYRRAGGIGDQEIGIARERGFVEQIDGLANGIGKLSLRAAEGGEAICCIKGLLRS